MLLIDCPGRCCLLAAALWVGLTSSVPADDAGMPGAEDLLARHIEKTGGRAAYEKLRNRRIKGTLEYPTSGLKGEMEIHQSADNQYKVRAEIAGFGQSLEGCDGKVGWTQNPMQGTQIIQGEELAVKQRQTSFHPILKWKTWYDQAEVQGREDVEGRSCYKVQMTPKVGEPETLFIDADNYRILKSVITVRNPMGSIQVESYFSDFREVDGIPVGHKTVQKFMGQESHLVYSEVQHNVPIPANFFDLPPDVAAKVAPPAASQPAP